MGRGYALDLINLAYSASANASSAEKFMGGFYPPSDYCITGRICLQPLIVYNTHGDVYPFLNWPQLIVKYAIFNLII
jgi:hypothetical protein